MPDDRWDRIEALFDEALQLDETLVPAWLAGLDPDVRGDLERLLRAHRASASFLEAPAAETAAALVAEESEADVAGTRLGPYRLIREIGRGGMGAVFLAHRDDVGLDVAIKRLPHTFASSRAVRAFLSERRTLARLEHPHIARLLDAGLADGGGPYFVMEWVEGESLTVYCDAKRLGVRDRLILFLDICRAVEYAHGQLVVHRDLKPSNVLVTRDGVPKLLDFGIAKVLDDSGVAAATQTIDKLMTPMYASPEQIRGEVVGTTTDVYSLGALLYELLAGRPPHDVDTGTPFEVGRAILESEPPPLHSAVPEDAAVEIAALRSTALRRLHHQLAGDLSVIVAQAMHKDPARRYPSVAAMAADLRRHLDGEAVLARGDALTYRATRFVRRRWLPLSAAATALIAFVSFASFHTRRIGAERDRAQREARTAESVSDFLIDVFLASDPDRSDGTEPTAQDLLERGVERVRSEVDGDPAVRAQLLQALGDVQRKRGRLEEAKPLLEESLALRRQAYPEGHPRLIQSFDHLSSLRASMNDWPGALEMARAAYDMSERLHGPNDQETIYRLHNLGVFTKRAGNDSLAEEILRRSLVERRRLLGNEHEGVAHAARALADLLRDLERYDEAQALYDESLATSRAIYGDDHARVGSVWHNMGLMHSRRRHFGEAERCLTEALRIRKKVYGEKSVKLLSTLSARAAARNESGDFAGAEQDCLDALALENIGDERADLLESLARARVGLGRGASVESGFAARDGS